MKKLTLLLLISCLLFSCKKDKEESTPPEATVKEKLPVVMVHGFLASGDTYEKQMLRFASNGYPQDFLYAFNWNSLNLSANKEKELDDFINDVLLKTGASQVDLVGHSAGSTSVYEYCKQDARAKKVRNVVLLAGFLQPGPAGSSKTRIPTLNIFSPDDKIVALGGNINAAKNLSLPKKDHYQVATSAETFAAMYEMFTGEKPATTDIISKENPTISGNVLSFGENISGKDAVLEIYEVYSESGLRKNTTPDFTFTINDKNEWGPIQVKSGAHYEFRVTTGKPNDRPVHYYREPFARDNKNVVIRYYPPTGSLASLFLTNLPNDDNRAVNAFFGASQAVIVDRDVLKVNDVVLSNNKLASEANTTIAMFMYDENNNQVSEERPINSFSLFPFLAGVDLHFPVGDGASSKFEYNGRILHVPNWPSATEGVAIAVFD